MTRVNCVNHGQSTQDNYNTDHWTQTSDQQHHDMTPRLQLRSLERDESGDLANYNKIRRCGFMDKGQNGSSKSPDSEADNCRSLEHQRWHQSIAHSGPHIHIGDENQVAERSAVNVSVQASLSRLMEETARQQQQRPLQLVSNPKVETGAARDGTARPSAYASDREIITWTRKGSSLEPKHAGFLSGF
ncbi:hypothetical protein PoB_000453600 [Plakobranchus ocellatus]|uniref:Uncharacterized protein n=1 Tax=Plakobranchus ocellatus TaxID=259542 RepID=A0AAV3Y494_9GAST|nr:hypothetical protein PoB_000453600 [Plakobranchus ocellatus]